MRLYSCIYQLLDNSRGERSQQSQIKGRKHLMLGLMQDWPLLCHRIIDHAAFCYPDREVVTRSVEGPIHRTNYSEVRARALKVARRLDRDASFHKQRPSFFDRLTPAGEFPLRLMFAAM